MKKLLLFIAGLIALVFILVLGYYLKVRVVPPISEWRTEAKIFTKGKDHYTSANGSEIRKNDHGMWEMRIVGCAEERGENFGALAQQLLKSKEEAFVGEIENRVPSPSYLRFLKYLVGWFNRDLDEYVPQEFLLEIAASAKYMPDKYDYIAEKYQRALSYHAAHDIGHALQNMNLVGCTSFAVWGKKSKNEKLLIGRNFDFYFGDEFAKDQIIAFYQPDSGYQFMSVTWACFTGVVSGMNEKGLSITLNSAKSDIPGKGKTPVSLLARQILQYAANIEEAYQIAQSFDTFVAETFLIGSKVDARVVLIEKTPDKTAIHSGDDNILIATNHLQSEALKNSPLNLEYETEGVSQYRYARVLELADSLAPIDPVRAAYILRDKRGASGTDIGLGNEKAINQLIAHHSVIFAPEEMKAWVSSPPYQLGKYLAYDLEEIFSNSGTISYNKALCIAQDPFVKTQEFNRFNEFSATKETIQKYLFGSRSQSVARSQLDSFIELNPHSFLGYYYLGDYYLKTENWAEAATTLRQGLRQEIARSSERQHMEEGLARAEAKLR